MFRKQATVQIDLPASVTFNYLRWRYDSAIFKDACFDAKGYVPAIKCILEEPERRLAFQVPGRDPVAKIFISGWKWGYDFESTSPSSTKVTIWYTYSWFMAFLGMGTTGHQATNEIVETALALYALSEK